MQSQFERSAALEEKRKPRRKKKPNKAQRDRIRTERADTFNEGFKMGYSMGYEQGRRDQKEEIDCLSIHTMTC